MAKKAVKVAKKKAAAPKPFSVAQRAHHGGH